MPNKSLTWNFEDEEALDGVLLFIEDIDFEDVDIEKQRNLHNEYSKFPSEESRLKNKIAIQDILNYLPSKVLINTKIYQFTLKYKGPNVWLHFVCKVDEIIREGEEGEGCPVNEIEEILSPDIPFAFHEDDTAYLLMEVLRLLIDVNAIEVKENLKLDGNHKIHEHLNYIMEL